MNRKIAIVIIIILGILIISRSGRTIIDPGYTEEQLNHMDSLDNEIDSLEIDTVSEYIPQTIKFEEYIPQSERLMV